MEEWIKKENVGIIIFDVNERRIKDEVRHIPVEDLFPQIQSFVKDIEKKEIICFTSENVPEAKRNELHNFLTEEKMVGALPQEDIKEKSYCMFESNLIPYYSDKEVIDSNSMNGGYYQVEYNKSKTLQYSDTEAPFFPDFEGTDVLVSDSLQDVVRYFLHKKIIHVLLLGYQKDIKSIVTNWGIDFMLAFNIQPYFVPNLIDINLSKYKYPYMNFPVSRDILIEKLCEERMCIQKRIGYCRILHTETSESAIIGDITPTELAEKSIYPSYNAAKRPAFMREIYIKREKDIISDIVQCFDSIGGYICFSTVQGTFDFASEGKEKLSGYKRLAHFKPGELISEIEIKVLEDSKLLAELMIVTTNGEKYNSDSDHSTLTSQKIFNSGGRPVTVLCMEYLVLGGGVTVAGVAETGYIPFLIRKKSEQQNHEEITLKFCYPYEIYEAVDKRKQLPMKFETLFFEGYFYLYQNGKFLRKSTYLLMSSGFDKAVYKLTPDLLEKSAPNNTFLPYADWEMNEGEFLWQVKEETKKKSKEEARLLDDDEADSQDDSEKEILEFSEKINLYVMEKQEITAGGSSSQELFQKNMEGICCLKNQADLKALAAAVNSGGEDCYGQRYAKLKYQLEADIEWEGKWIPVGSDQNPFNGVLNGKGHVIKGISNGDCGDSCQGFFGVMGEHAEVKNLAIRNGEIRGNDCVGGIAGKSFGIISNCFYEGKVTAAGSWAGGISGFQQGGGITYCCAVVSVEGSKFAGGLCGAGYRGMNSVGITFSYVLSKVSAGQNGDWLYGLLDGMISRSCTAIVYKTKMEEGECSEFWLGILEKSDEWDFKTYTVPVLKSIAKQPQIECLRAHLQELK